MVSHGYKCFHKNPKGFTLIQTNFEEREIVFNPNDDILHWLEGAIIFNETKI